MLDVEIKTIPDEAQRYNTVGDYLTDASGKISIQVSQFADERHEFLVAVHELIEAYLCRMRGVSDAAIDAFDMEYEKNRAPDDHASEPGNDATAPYHAEHRFATKIEQMIATELGVDWDEYVSACEKLMANDHTI